MTMMSKVAVLLLCCARSYLVNGQDDSTAAKAPMLVAEESPATKGSCEAEIRHCDRLLAEKDKACAEMRHESNQHCDDQLLIATEASQLAHGAHQAELQKLSSIISQIRSSKDSIHSECEQRVAESYSQGWREAELQYDEELAANKAFTASARSAHEKEIETLNAIISETRLSKETIQSECEQSVTDSYSKGWSEAETRFGAQMRANKSECEQSVTDSYSKGWSEAETEYGAQLMATKSECEQKVTDAYSKGWSEAETQYGDLLKASKEAASLSRSAYEEEVQTLMATISGLQTQKDGLHSSCERRVTESYSTGFSEADTKGRKLLDTAERQLASAKFMLRVQNEHLTAEKQRLETENREFSQMLSRTQNSLLETQRQLSQAQEKLDSKSAARKAFDWLVESIAHVWETFIKPGILFAWEEFGEERWERHGAPLWRHVQFVRGRIAIHGPLAVGLLTDIAQTALIEVSLLIRELPETLPQAMDDAWVASEPHRTQVLLIVEDAKMSLWNYTSTQTLMARSSISTAFQHVVQELNFEGMKPHIEIVKVQAAKVQQTLSPHLQRAHSVWEDARDQAGAKWTTTKEILLESSDRGLDRLNATMADVEAWKDDVMDQWCLFARTAFLFLRVYGAPKYLLDLTEYCSEYPEASLLMIVKFVCGVILCYEAWRLVFPVKKRKRLVEKRKVQFAVTQ